MQNRRFLSEIAHAELRNWCVGIAGEFDEWQCVKPGVSRWTVKTSLPSTRAKPVPMKLEELTSLAPPSSATTEKGTR
jgi:hypothetical protein